MPLRHRLKRTLPESANDLKQSLLQEWQHPRDAGQPLIVVDGGEAQPIHVYVIWDAWEGWSEYQRSEVIMDVLEQLAGEHRFEDIGLVTVAMGLTIAEAKQMGIAVE